MEFVVDQLRLLKLNDREIKVFTTLSMFGPMTVTKIAGRSGLPRTTVDAIARRLHEHGLFSKVKVKQHWEWNVDLEDVTKKLSVLQNRLSPKNGGVSHETRRSRKLHEEVAAQLLSIPTNATMRIVLGLGHPDMIEPLLFHLKHEGCKRAVLIAISKGVASAYPHILQELKSYGCRKMIKVRDAIIPEPVDVLAIDGVEGFVVQYGKGMEVLPVAAGVLIKALFLSVGKRK